MKQILLLVVIFSQTLAYAAFTDEAWEKVKPVYAKIVAHPFNVEVGKGTLPAAKFSHYSSQDSLYLTDFAKALALLAVKLDDPERIRQVMGFVEDCLKEKGTKGAEAEAMSEATLFYTSYLLATAAHRSREELAAALLPCFWVYLEVARELKKGLRSGNPYADWITQYSSAGYEKDVIRMKEVVDELASAATPALRNKMLAAFEIATRLELRFWDSTYETR